MIHVPLGTDFQDKNGTAGSSRLLRLEVPSAGVLSAFALGAPGSDDPTLTLAAVECGGEASALARTLRWQGWNLILRIDSPGVVFLLVRTPPGSGGPIRYQVATSFAADPAWEEPPIQPAQDPPETCGPNDDSPVILAAGGESSSTGVGGGVDPWDCDIVAGSLTGGVVILEAEGTPITASIFVGNSCEERLAEGDLIGPDDWIAAPVRKGEHRFAVDPVLASSGQYLLRIRHFPLCGQVDDDHGDIPLCASPLEVGKTEFGRLASSMEGDSDFFHFSLPKATTVAVQLQGSGSHCQLYNSSGQRITSWKNCNGNDSHPLVRTLTAGAYDLRVTSGGTEPVSYSLGLARID